MKQADIADFLGKDFAPTPAEKRRVHGGKHKPPVKRGYAWQPGTGPKSETCKSCKHIVRKCLAKTYLKCGLMSAHWTGGGGTDILAGSPACKFWESQA